MYVNLESRVFNSYLLQSANEFSGYDKNDANEKSLLALYEWTRNVYTVFAKAPELMISQLSEDMNFPNTYTAEKNGRPKLKAEMRKAITAMNSFLRVVWEAALLGVCNDNSLSLPDGYMITKKNVKLLEYTGIKIIDNSLYAENYHGMFSALQQLTKQTDGFSPPWKYREEIFTPELSIYTNGFKRFVRCVYNDTHLLIENIFEKLSGNSSAYKHLTLWLRNNCYDFGNSYDTSEVRNLESSAISFKKNINDNNSSVEQLMLYDHEHIGFIAKFETLSELPQSFQLIIQKPRDVLTNFDVLPSAVCKFIIKYHSKCNNCGYCTQRSKGKSKPFTICVKFNDIAYPLCPINHVYTYRWNTLTDELVEELIAYLKYLQNNLHS